MEEFLKKYNTSEEGLSSNEVTKRQNQNGLNELKEKKKKSAVMLFLEQFIDVLIALLIVAAIAAYFCWRRYRLMCNFNSCTFKYSNRIHTGIPFRKSN